MFFKPQEAKDLQQREIAFAAAAGYIELKSDYSDSLETHHDWTFICAAYLGSLASTTFSKQKGAVQFNEGTILF